LNIAKKLKKLLRASEVVRKIDNKLSSRNKIYLEHIKNVEKLVRSMNIKLPDSSKVKKFLKKRKLEIIASELGDLPKKYKNSI